MSSSVGFSAWVHWNNRRLLTERTSPGVYLLARFEDEPPIDPDPLYRFVLLIAETHDQTLDARWNQFHLSAFKGRFGHSGGLHFYNLFNNGADTAVPPWLFVSALSSPADGDVAQHNKAIKRQLLADYEGRYGILPCCNARNTATETVGTEERAPSSHGEVAPSNKEIAQASGVPEVDFGAWTRWDERATIAGLTFPGVYLLAQFEERPPSRVETADERIVYIGETCDNDLSGRLRQFNRSAFDGKDGHSGGWSYRSRCHQSGPNLYVSVFAVSKLNEPMRSSFIRHIERHLLWEYVMRWGKRPICNSK